jgi:uncharacterized protein YgiM (DUF1202 family)
MKTLAAAALLLLAACSRETAEPVTETIDTRTPVAVLYAGVSALNVHAQPNPQAEVIATYQSGEAVSVLARQEEWSEIRTGSRTGWVRNSELVTAEQKNQAEEAPSPKFVRVPMPVSAPGAKGAIYIEADVNTDGDVVSTRIISNTTGSQALAFQNAEALKTAKFEPIVVKGERKAFKYYHNVSY